MKKITGKAFTPEKGYTLTSKAPDHEQQILLGLPSACLKGLDNADDIIEKISKGPQHEILMYAIALQTICWAEKMVKEFGKAVYDI